MAVHGVGMANATFRLWFFCMLLIATMDLSHESFKHWNALNCVIRGPSLFVKTFARSFRGNTKAYWIVFSSNIKPYILRSSLMVNLEFWIPLAAPPFPISILHLLSLIVGWEGGAGGALVRSVDIYYYDEVFMFLLTTRRYVCREIYIFVACRISSEILSVWSRRTRTCDV